MLIRDASSMNMFQTIYGCQIQSPALFPSLDQMTSNTRDSPDLFVLLLLAHL